MPKGNITFDIRAARGKISQIDFSAGVERAPLEIPYMNIKRAGQSKPLKFGCCASEDGIRKYVLLEGFYIGEVTCLSCAKCYDLIINPNTRSKASPKRFKSVVIQEICIHCGNIGVRITSIKKS